METPELFNQIASHYEQWSNVLSGEGIRAWHHFAVEQLDIRPGESVLDVGCGTGVATRMLAERAGSLGQVTGLDPSKAMLAEARRHVQFPPVAWVEGEGEHLPFPNEHFDAVTAQFSLRNMRDWSAALREMVRVLKPGGRLVLLDIVQPMSTLGSVAWNGLKAVTQHLTGSHVKAYQWLGMSVEHAPTRLELLTEASRLGIDAVTAHGWLGDLVVAVSGKKGDPTARAQLSPLSVMWAVDGSATALGVAEGLNRMLAPGCPIHIVSVVPGATADPELQETDERTWRQHAEAAKRRLLPGRFQVSVTLLHGDPGPTLVRYQIEQQVALCVVGQKGRSRRADHYAGSVARYLSDHATCAVLMVPTGLLTPVHPAM